MSQRGSYLLCVLFLLACYVDSLAAPQNLNMIERQIHRLKNYIGQTEIKQSSLERKLKHADIKIGKMGYRYRANQRLQERQEEILSKLTRHHAQYEKAIKQQQAAFDREMRAAYMLGQVDYLKVLFNQQDPEKLSRMMTYYTYFSNNREEIIRRYEKDLLWVEKNRQRIEHSRLHLASINHRLEKQRAHLKTERQKRKKLLAQMHQKMKSQKQALKELLENKKALEKVVANVEKQTVKDHTAYYPPSGVAFEHLKSRLPWPTHGKIVRQYGTPIEHSQLTWQGIIISAPTGQAVHAIASGRVAFAKWLTGYGLLMIIDHGEGYMSLYGRNDSLYKQEGDLVSPGDVIATVGRSGGYQTSGLYFALRKKEKPLDPNGWCK